MEPINFETPSGHNVTLKPFLTFGDKRSLERVFAEGMSVDPASGTSNASGKAIYDAQDKAVTMLVLTIKTAEGQTVDNGDPDKLLAVIYAMKDEDGRAIYDRVNELTNSPGEKRGA